MGTYPRVRRSVAAVSSGALVVGAGAAVGLLSAGMADEWSHQAALRAASEPVAEAVSIDAPSPSPKVITRVKIRRITPDPVIIRKKVIVRVPVQAQSAPRTAPQGTTSSSTSRSAPGGGTPSRKVIAPAPKPAAPALAPRQAAPKPKAPSAGKTSKAS